jgi:hypothetical protein
MSSLVPAAAWRDAAAAVLGSAFVGVTAAITLGLVAWAAIASAGFPGYSLIGGEAAGGLAGLALCALTLRQALRIAREAPPADAAD